MCQNLWGKLANPVSLGLPTVTTPGALYITLAFYVLHQPSGIDQEGTWISYG